MVKQGKPEKGSFKLLHTVKMTKLITDQTVPGVSAITSKPTDSKF